MYKIGASSTLVNLMTLGTNSESILWIRYSIKTEKQNQFGIFAMNEMLYYSN